ncbi:DNA-binding TFAR19-related protein (PDSD5 family) [Streptococcus rupicaprae]|uniref:DNA-binding TFAR19-related protein (PDSD5 family) n=1 Tax=Streptococcus rupicaprae TaxID=759619 RepID=A0ABV2FHI1_9STRE
MKKYFYLSLCGILLLTACAKQSEKESSSMQEEKAAKSASESQSTPSEETKSNALTKAAFEQLISVPLVKVDSTKVTDYQLASANNGVIKTSIDGKEQIAYRLYQVPDHWELFPGKAVEDRQIAYLLTLEQVQVAVPLSVENAYTSSPLDGGEVASLEEVDAWIEENNPVVHKSVIDIDGQEWQVVYSHDEGDSNASGLLFYRLENTGNFDDSLLMASLIFPANIEELGGLDQLKEPIGELKHVLAQLAKKP